MDMRRYVTILGCLVYWGVGCVLPAFGSGEADRPRSVLYGIAALDKPVTYTETKVPLGELVQRVAKDTGVALGAAPDVADEPLAVIVTALPARELLQQIGELLDYRWSRRRRPRNGTGWCYEIWQDLASKQREEAFRRALRDDVERRWQEEIARYVSMAALTPEQIEAIRKGAEPHQPALGKPTPEPIQADGGSSKGRDRGRTAEVAAWLSSPISRSLAGLFGRLTAQQWKVLREEGRLLFSTNPQTGELPLPPDIADVFRSSQPRRLPPEARMISSYPGGEQGLRDHEEELRQQWKEAADYRAWIRLEDDGFSTRCLIHLTAKVVPLRSNLEFVSTGFLYDLPIGTIVSMDVDPVDYWQLKEEDTPERQAQLDADSVLGTRRSLRPGIEPHLDAARPDGNSVGELRRLLADIARTYGVNLISDSYWNNPLHLERPSFSREAAPLYWWLDHLAGTTHCWERRGNLIRLRSRTWFVDRSLEIPLRLVRRWQGLYAELGALPLHECVAMATTLTEGQLQCLRSVVRDGTLPDEVVQIYLARYPLRLYGSLTPVQQQIVWQGGVLPGSQFLPSQQAVLRTALRYPDRSRPGPSRLGSLADMRFSLTHEAYLRLRGTAGGSASYVDVPEPSAAAARAAPAGRSAGNAKYRGAAGEPPRAAAGPAKRYPVTRVHFHCAGYLGAPEGYTLSVAREALGRSSDIVPSAGAPYGSTK
jgi:hypothetical protein